MRLEFRHICCKVHDQVDDDYLDQGVFEFADPLSPHPKWQLLPNSVGEIEGEAESDPESEDDEHEPKQERISRFHHRDDDRLRPLLLG